MPELPEVEVVKRSLQRNILNLIIKKVKINLIFSNKLSRLNLITFSYLFEKIIIYFKGVCDN